MKNTFLIPGIALLFAGTVVQAQETPAQPQQPSTEKKVSNPTVDSITSKYTLSPMPVFNDPVFPVVGEYKSSGTETTGNVSIKLDDQNKGCVWVEGLPQGKFKALLKASPATYKIPAQKNADGKDIAEGTLIYDKTTKTVSICIGKPFNDANPSSAFTMSAATEDTPVETKTVKGKKPVIIKTVLAKPWIFTGIKIEQPATAMQ